MNVLLALDVLTYLVTTVFDLYSREALIVSIPERHDESMHAMIIYSAAAIRRWHLQACKNSAHLAVLSCIPNPPVQAIPIMS